MASSSLELLRSSAACCFALSLAATSSACNYFSRANARELSSHAFSNCCCVGLSASGVSGTIMLRWPCSACARDLSNKDSDASNRISRSDEEVLFWGESIVIVATVISTVTVVTVISRYSWEYVPLPDLQHREYSGDAKFQLHSTNS